MNYELKKAGGDRRGRLSSYLVLYWGLLCLPQFPEGAQPFVTLASCFLRNFFVAAVLAWWSRKRWAKILITSVLGLLFFVEMYCKLHQGCRLNESMLFLAMQSDPQETLEYLSTFFFSLKTLYALLLTAAVIVGGLLLNRLCQHLSPPKNKKIRIVGRILFWMLFGLSLSLSFTLSKPSTVAGIFVSLPFWGTILMPLIALGWRRLMATRRVRSSRPLTQLMRWLPNVCIAAIMIVNVEPDLALRGMRGGEPFFYRHNTVQQFAQSWIQLYDNRDDMAMLTETCQNIRIKARKYPDGLPFKLVVVIGESYNPTHSGLYGYRLPTTPNLQKERKAGNLVVYSDAYTRIPITYQVMHESLSLWRHTDTARWEKYPLLPAVVKRAGYRVAMIDNHSTRLSTDHASFASSAFYSSAEMNDLCFDMRNDSVFRYDGMIVDRYVPRFFDADFSIIHLMGQHIDARERYPEEFDRFGVEDYDFKRGFNDRQKRVIANYDNATLYNDFVLKKIIDYYRDESAIIIYFADHGEEVYDFRDNYGRTQQMDLPELRPHMYHVPYMVWMSDSFLASQPDIAARLAAAQSAPTLNSDISFVVLDLLGITCAD